MAEEGEMMMNMRALATASTIAIATVGQAASAQTAPDNGVPLPATATVATTPPAATTADGGDGIPDIVVFGQRRGFGESSQKVSIAVTALDATSLRAANTATIADIGSLAPNVQTTLVGTTAAFPNFTIRGIGINSSLRSVDPGVNIIQDGVVLAYQAGALPSTFDLEGIEVLRGPQGVLFGRNATGGAISLRTRRPQEAPQVLGYLDYGNFNTVDANSSVEGALGSPNALGKLAVIYRRSDGFFKNTLGGTYVAAPGNPTGQPVQHSTHNIGAVDELTIKPTFLFKLGASTLTLFGQYQRFNDDGSSPRNFLPPAGGATVPLQTVFGFTPPAGKYVTNLLDPGALRLREYHLFGELANDIGPGKLTTVAGYRHVQYDATSNTVGSPFLLLFLPSRERNTEYSVESRYNVALLPDKLDLLVGGFFLSSDTNVQDNRITSNAPASPTTVTYATSPFSQLTSAVAGFANLDLHLAEKITLSAGGRYSTELKNFNGSPVANCIGTGFGNCPQAFTRVRKRFNDFSPRLVATYQAKDFLLYASYTKGFRSGNINSRVRAASGFTPADPENVKSYEVGAKSDLFGRKLRLNLTGFIADYGDIQEILTSSVAGSALVQSLFNAASARIKGVEAELVLRPAHGLQLEGNYGLTDAKFKTFTIAVAGVADPLALKFARIPRNTASGAIQYRYDLGGGRNVTARIAYDWRSGYFSDLQNTPELYQKSYGLLNANIGYDAGAWSVGVFGRNLANIDYADLKGRSTAYTEYGGVPRTYGVRASFKFGG